MRSALSITSTPLDAEVLRFELMIERRLYEQPQASGKEAQHEVLCRTGRFCERDSDLHCR